MNLSEPYSAICPSLEGPVLDVLAHTTRPLTGREISRLARRGSERGVRLVLARLSEHGLVDRQEAGAASLYVLNRDHIAATVVLSLVGLRDDLFDRIRHAISAWDIQPVHASVFGSAARGDGQVESDIDLLIIRPHDIDADEAPWRDQLGSLAEHVRRWSGNNAAIAELSRKQLSSAIRRRESIIDEVSTATITLAGPEFSSVIGRARARALT